MKRQLEAAEDYLQDAMEAKEKEIMRKTQRTIDEKVEEEKNAYKTKLAEMVGRMQGIESALKSMCWFNIFLLRCFILFSSLQKIL